MDGEGEDSLEWKDPLLNEDKSFNEFELEDDLNEIPVRKGIRGLGFFICLISWWFGWNLVSAATTAVIWPSQIAAIVGESKKEIFNGFVPALGLLIHL